MVSPHGKEMKEAPRGFAVDRLHATLLDLWGIRARELDYLPVGFGAHHWRATEGSRRAYFLALHHLGPDTKLDSTSSRGHCAPHTGFAIFGTWNLSSRRCPTMRAAYTLEPVVSAYWHDNVPLCGAVR